MAILFSTESATYIQTLSAVLASKPKRSLLRLHLTFVLGRVYPNLESKFKEQVITEIVFPFLLFSKPRQHTAEVVWYIMAETMIEETGMECEMLKGCADIVKAEREENNGDVVEKMRSINAALSIKIARKYQTPL